MSHRLDPPLTAPTPRLRPVSRGIWLGLVAVVAGLAFWLGGRLAARPASPSTAGLPAELAARMESLQGALAVERAARESLAQELAELHAQLDALVAQLEASRPAAGPEAGAAAEPSAREEGGAEEAGTAPDPARAPVFDVAPLVAGCMSRPDAETLRARWERYQLDRLELNDRALRGSYFMTPRHRDEHAALDGAFRDELGDDGYDAYLRATHRPNRFALREVLASGAGSAAGLQAGDELVRYAGERVFSAADLQALTSSGRPGEIVAIEVLRGGQPTTLRATRGPLGVVLEGVVRAPEGGC
jgi:hypothetical protein